MDQRLNFVTLAVADVERSRSFYADGLGWEPELVVPGEVMFLRVGPGLVLSLWDRAAFIAEVGAPGPGPAPLTLSHNVPTPADVDAALRDAARAGATILVDPAAREWGGYSGYFTDPDGYRWEVAHNPGPVGQDVLAESLAWWVERGRRRAGYPDTAATAPPDQGGPRPEEL